MLKRKPRREELKSYQEKVTYKGKEYEQTVFDKMGDDGVMESHIDYVPRHAPKGVKTRGNYNIGMCLPTCKAACCRNKKGRK